MHVGEGLVELLAQMGVRHVFGVPGGQTLPFYEGIWKSTAGIRHVLMRDERSAGFAADANARVSRVIGVCDATVGPGATNLLSPLAEAFCSSVPILAIVSDIPRAWEFRRHRGNASQAMDQLAMFRPVSKWQVSLTEPGSLEKIVDQAVRVAVTGRPGPVVLAVPDDIAGSQTVLNAAAVLRSGGFPRHRPSPDPARIAQTVQALRQATRPVLLIGGGAHISGAGSQVADLAHRLKIPVVTSLSGKGVLADDDPLCFGVTGSMGSPTANEIVRRADLIFFVGCKGGQLATYGYDHPVPGTTIIHLDIDPEEIDRNFPGSIALVGDVRSGLTVLMEDLKTGDGAYQWDLEAESQRQHQWYHETTEPSRESRALLAPQMVMKTIDSFLTPDDVVVCDASLASGWAAVYLHLKSAGRHYLAPRGLAGLGWGAPAAIGAALARPGRRILHFAGDGGFGYSVQELEVMARLNLPIVSIILNNDTLGWIKHIQKSRYQERFISCDFNHIDFETVARGFGVRSYTAASLADISQIMSAEASPRGPALVDVGIDPWETPVLRNASGPG